MRSGRRGDLGQRFLSVSLAAIAADAEERLMVPLIAGGGPSDYAIALTFPSPQNPQAGVGRSN